MDWFNQIKEGFIVPRTGFEPVTYGLEIDWIIELRIKLLSSIKAMEIIHHHYLKIVQKYILCGKYNKKRLPRQLILGN